MSTITNEQLEENAKLLLVELLNREDPLKPKDRMKIPPQSVLEQDEFARRHNLDEVSMGLTLEQARVEAMRCL